MTVAPLVKRGAPRLAMALNWRTESYSKRNESKVLHLRINSVRHGSELPQFAGTSTQRSRLRKKARRSSRWITSGPQSLGVRATRGCCRLVVAVSRGRGPNQFLSLLVEIVLLFLVRGGSERFALCGLIAQLVCLDREPESHRRVFDFDSMGRSTLLVPQIAGMAMRDR
jgi:hypothetical protein